MADALCGPSNALQNFQKHSTADRTLQQDRLVSRPPLSQGFRSAPGPNAGLLDPEFEAFQAGKLPTPLTYQEVNQIPRRPIPTHHQSHQASASAWATDFQQLSLSNPWPRLQQQHYGQQIQNAGWMSEFLNQQNQSNGQLSNQPSYHPFQPLSQQNGGFVGGTQYGGSAGEPQQIQHFQPTKEEGFDEAAFARAFDQAAQSELALEQEMGLQQEEEQATIMLQESAERLLYSDSSLDQERIGADAIYHPLSSDVEPTQNDPDALSRTAGELLDRVKDNQSAKFQNSQFLLLIRQIRDKEKVVVGDKIVNTEAAS